MATSQRPPDDEGPPYPDPVPHPDPMSTAELRAIWRKATKNIPPKPKETPKEAA